jgi:class 3 adenylate cyclase
MTLGPHHRELDCAVMFVDMRGFTRASARLRSVELLDLLESYFALVVEVATARDGRPCNMTGDGMLAAFGLDGLAGAEAADGPAPRALRAAREVLDGWKALSARWQAQHDVTTGLGIGIHLGPVIAGPIGPPRFRHDTIVGDTVNVAARLCQRARAGEASTRSASRCSNCRRCRCAAAMPRSPCIACPRPSASTSARIEARRMGDGPG